MHSQLPQQAHRTLVRYRITVTDSLGASRRAPFEDDPSLNFACFVYDGVPAYQNFTAESLVTLPVYTLITRSPDGGSANPSPLLLRVQPGRRLVRQLRL